MDEIYNFDKSFHERLLECTDILSGRNIPASQIKKEWSCFLEIVIDHVGWQSLWKIPRVKCYELNINYPNVVLVYVQSINFEQLTACVKIVAVQDEISLPEIVTVSLINLYPTIKQDESIALNMPTTAEMLDILRFFYNHVWMPWDNDEDDSEDWPKKYLESRIRLYYDMKCGIIPRSSAEYIRSLINEAKSIKGKLEVIENEFDDFEDIKAEKSDKVEALTKLHLRFSQIKSEMEVFENPSLRAVLLKSNGKYSEHSNNPEYWVVFKPDIILNLIEYLDKVKKKLPPNTIVKPAININDALERANPGDNVLLSQGVHNIQSAGNFECGGNLCGIYSNFETILEAEQEDGKTLLDLSCNNMLLENLTIKISNSSCFALVRRGKVTLHNCLIICESELLNRQGIIALQGSTIIMEKCKISGFSCGIIANSGSKVSITDCIISHCDIGIKIYDDIDINLSKSSVLHCKMYGLCLESTKHKTYEDCIDMSSIHGIEMISTVIENNNKSNTIIIQKPSNIYDLIGTPTEEFADKDSFAEEVMGSMDVVI